MRAPAAPLVAFVVGLGLGAACAGTDGGAPGRSPRGSITVLAAASLQDAFTELGRRFEARYPGTSARFSFDASSTLARQAEAGAPADVVATADEASMAPLVGAGLVSTPTVFARNRLAVLVARGNPRGVRSLGDLARGDLAVVVCAPDVPCGRLAGAAFDKAGIAVRPRSLEPNVRGVVAKVALGEADAGVVYATDVGAAGGRAEGVPIAEEHNVVARCPVATVRSAPNPEAATRFVDLLRSDEGQGVLAAAGFET